jgi:hypothetical protein
MVRMDRKRTSARASWTWRPRRPPWHCTRLRGLTGMSARQRERSQRARRALIIRRRTATDGVLSLDDLRRVCPRRRRAGTRGSRARRPTSPGAAFPRHRTRLRDFAARMDAPAREFAARTIRLDSSPSSAHGRCGARELDELRRDRCVDGARGSTHTQLAEAAAARPRRASRGAPHEAGRSYPVDVSGTYRE